MAVDETDVQREVGTTWDDEDLSRCLTVARVLVTKYIADQELIEADLPEAIVDEALIVTASELYHLRNAPNGVLAQQYGETDVAAPPVRIGGDPLRAARHVLAPWTLPAIG